MDGGISNIIYYSDNCDKSIKLLEYLATHNKTDHFYYICVDNQIVEEGKTYITFSNNMKLIKPNTLKSTPSIMKMKNNYKLISGDEIEEYIKSFPSTSELPTYGNIVPSIPDTNRGKLENDVPLF